MLFGGPSSIAPFYQCGIRPSFNCPRRDAVFLCGSLKRCFVTLDSCDRSYDAIIGVPDLRRHGLELGYGSWAEVACAFRNAAFLTAFRCCWSFRASHRLTFRRSISKESPLFEAACFRPAFLSLSATEAVVLSCGSSESERDIVVGNSQPILSPIRLSRRPVAHPHIVPHGRRRHALRQSHDRSHIRKR